MERSASPGIDGEQARFRVIACWFSITALLLALCTSPVSAQTPGTLDASFHPGTGPDWFPYVLAAPTSSSPFIGGYISQYNGTPWQGLIRLDGAGGLDTGFGSPSSGGGSVNAVAVLADGSVLVAGAFTQWFGVPRARIAKLLPNGTLDTGFDPGAGADGTIFCIALQPDGKILVGGDFTTFDGVSKVRVARLESDGSLDPTFALPGTGPNNWVRGLTLQRDGKVLVSGPFSQIGSFTRSYLVRVESNGDLDAAFAPVFDSLVYATAQQPDGKIFLAGAFTNCVARLNSDGSLDGTFNPGTGPSQPVYAAPLQADGKIVIGGNFTFVGSEPRNRLARLNANGSPDLSFGTASPTDGADNTIYSAALQPDGKVLVGGPFSTFDATGRQYVARATNSPATSTLSATAPDRVLWARGGSAPELWRATLEYSAEGTAWSPLGNATPTTGGWEVTDLTLPLHGHLRARGWVALVGVSGSSAYTVTETTPYSLVEISVSGNGTDLIDGDASASTIDHTDFGAVNAAGGSVVRTFTIGNGGVADLLLTGSPLVGLSGSSAFSVTTPPTEAIVAPGGTRTFSVTFAPSAYGSASATVSIKSEDLDEDPFTFVVAGLHEIPPVLETAAASNVSGSGATLGGEVLDQGGQSVTVRGVVLGTSVDPALSGGGVMDFPHASGGAGAFAVNAIGLSEGVTYHARAYGTNTVGTGYGVGVFFTTPTQVVFTLGVANYDREMLPGGQQDFHFTLAGPRVTKLVSGGGAPLRAELRNAADEVVALFEGDGDFDLESGLAAGDYRLRVYRLAGAGSGAAFDLTIDASELAETRPDVAVGTSPAALLGRNAFAPAVQVATLSSRTLRPVTGRAEAANRGRLSDALKLSGDRGNRFFKVTWYDPSGNVTAAITVGTLQTNALADGGNVLLQAVVTPDKRKLKKPGKNGARPRILRKTLTLAIRAVSVGEPLKSDTANLKVKTR